MVILVLTNWFNQKTKSNQLCYLIKIFENTLGMSSSEIKKSKSSSKENDKYVKEVTELRKVIRKNIMNSVMNFKTIEDTFLLPVNLFRLIQDYSDEKRKVNYKLKYEYILEKINEILTDKKTDLMSKQEKFQRKMNNIQRWYSS